MFTLWNDESAQDIAEYAVMLAVILVNCRRHHPPYRRQRQQRIFIGQQLDSVMFLSFAHESSSVHRRL
jgi:hypothetical protein